MVWNYTELVKKHFFEPKNVGEIENPDGKGDVGSIACGDALSLTIKVDKDTDTVVEAKFKTFGCGSAIASSSMLTEMIKGKTLDDALKITNQDIADKLGGLPPEKMHCSVMGREALEAAIGNYRGETIKHEDEDEGRVICNCFGITEGKIRRVIKEDALTTVEDITNYTKAGGACGACVGQIEDILDEMLEEKKEVQKKSEKDISKKKPLTNLQRITLIQEIIDNEIRPELEKDSGGIDLIDIDGLTVAIRMIGQCAGCMAANFTSAWIQDKLREVVDEKIVVKVVEEY
ncbi:MAG: Fe-S cluster assembly protein NifU [Deltaproteobacteria bacterium]|nr:Fe-S cluster assembly protein NifU [Deltaproteobacteria bacterium]